MGKKHFQPWTDFVAIHNATFNTLTTTFGDNAYFPAFIHVECLGQDLSPKVTNELGIRPFIRASIEKPAATVVSKYLEIVGHNHFKEVRFKNTVYGITQSSEDVMEPPRKRRSPVKDIGVPDRWLLDYYGDDKFQQILVGEIKPAHTLNGAKLNRVLSAPGDNFFLRATRQEKASTSGQVPGEVYVAKALCQAFHYMITSGLEFGYVATGEGLVFLCVLEEDPNTLYYFKSTFPVNNILGVMAIREPRETTMAQLATLCMLSLGSTQRPRRWIEARNKDVKRWPKSKTALSSLPLMPPPLLPHDRGSGGDGSSGNGGGGDGGASRSSTQSTLKRPRSSSTTTGGSTTAAHGAQQAHSAMPFVAEPPTLPYCTQACLRGLCYGGLLDDMCPNAKLHRVVARGNNHALTANEVRTRVVAQLAENMERDCKSLLYEGYFGRYGVLFTITVTGFGYTFVAKAVLAGSRGILQHEAAIYAALQDLQGLLVPVCLGVIDLERPIPLMNCQSVAYMMLMSYAGPDLHSKTVPPGVDLELESERTQQELCAAGLLNDDIHGGNLAWNREVLHMMQFDFDDASIEPVREPPAATEPLPQRSPLQAKRHLNAFNEGGKWVGDDLMKKRPRTAT